MAEFTFDTLLKLLSFLCFSGMGSPWSTNVLRI